MNATTSKEIRLKDGSTIAANTVCGISFHNNPVATLETNGRSIRVRCASLPKYFARFKTPSLRTLEKAMDEGICPSVTGARVEPDGYGPDGSPSWLIALGLI